MEKRPKIKIKLTLTDKLFERIGWLLLLISWGMTITSYSTLPDIIPIHYNGAGQADGFGGKGYIFILPLIATILFVGLTILNKFPYIFNYPTQITAENALDQYTNATRLIRYLKFVIVIIFDVIAFVTIRSATGHSDGLGVLFLPLTMGLIFIPLAYFGFKSFKTK